MKYIGLDVTFKGLTADQPSVTKRMVVSFPDDLVHSMVADAMKHAARRQWRGADVKVSTAGFIEATARDTHGKSESLGIKSDANDARRFNMANYGGNIL